MEQGRYDITLSEVPPKIVEITQKGVLCGLVDKHTEPGFTLADGTVLLESEKDENGFYIGGAGMDGMYLRTPERYEPVRDEAGNIASFRLMSSYLTRFTGEEQKLIFQYAMNTKENLLHDLRAPLRVLKRSPEVYDLFSGTIRKLENIPSLGCMRLMADIRAAYKGRNEQSIRERQRAAKKSDHRSVEK